MSKVIYCRDLGFDCDGVVQADSERVALNRVVEHARNVHGLQEVTPEVVEKVKAAMREKPAET